MPLYEDDLGNIYFDERKDRAEVRIEPVRSQLTGTLVTPITIRKLRPGGIAELIRFSRIVVLLALVLVLLAILMAATLPKGMTTDIINIANLLLICSRLLFTQHIFKSVPHDRPVRLMADQPQLSKAKFNINLAVFSGLLVMFLIIYIDSGF